MMKKYYNEPELNVLHYGKEICTDNVIEVSGTKYGGTVYSGDRMGREDWDAGY